METINGERNQQDDWVSSKIKTKLKRQLCSVHKYTLFIYVGELIFC